MRVLGRETVGTPGRPPRVVARVGPVAVVLLTAVLAVVLTLGGSSADAAPVTGTVPAAPTTRPPDAHRLAALQRELDAATAEAQRTADAVLATAARSGQLRVALDDLAQQRAAAQRDFDTQAVELYEASPPGAVTTTEAMFTDPELGELLRAQQYRLSGVPDVLQRASTAAARLQQLTVGADRLRAGLVEKAQAVVTAQDHARALLAQAQAEYAAARADASTRAALAHLQATQAQLDRTSQRVAISVGPGLTAAGTAALGRQQPLLAALRAAGSGYPADYAPTGQSVTGTSSWYGPGFVGRPTASGAPYDPEALTCAMRIVPLGTVVRVTNPANGHAVDLLVNDRGPYVGDRIIDVSHAGATALGFDGLVTVSIEVLAPTGSRG